MSNNVLFTFLREQIGSFTEPQKIREIVDIFYGTNDTQFKNFLKDIVKAVYPQNSPIKQQLIAAIDSTSAQQIRNAIETTIENISKTLQIDEQPIVQNAFSEENIQQILDIVENSSYIENIEIESISDRCKDEPIQSFGPTDLVNITQEVPTIISKITDIYYYSNRKRYVTLSSVGEISSYLRDGASSGFVSQDSFRSRSGNFWYYLEERYPLLLPIINKAKDFSTLSNTDFGSLQEYIEAAQSKTKNYTITNIQKIYDFNNERDILLYKETMRHDVGFVNQIDRRDYVFITEIPYNRADLKIFERAGLEPANSLRIEIENDYNFYVSSYESLLNSTEQNINARLLPNFYILLTDNFRETKNLSNLQENVLGTISQNSYLDNFSHRNIMSISGAISIDANNDEYYDIFSSQFSQAVTTQKEYVDNKMQNVVFSSNEISLYNEFEHKKENFPFYIKLKFDTEGYGPVSKILKDLNLTDILLSMIATEQRTTESKEGFSISSESFTEKTIQKSITFFDLKQKIKDIFSGTKKCDTKFTTYLGLLESEIQNYNNFGLSEQYSICYFLFDQFIENLKENNGRKFQEIMDGKTCYAETIFYRIDKWERNEQGNKTKLQSFYLPNVNNIQELSIIDTQVKYEHLYTYDIYSYKAVLGNNFSYENKDEENCEITNIPCVSLIECEYNNAQGIVTDKPPPPPEVTLVPYKDHSDKILVLFNPSTVEYNMHAIVFSEEEKLQYSLIRQSQQIELEEKVKFGGDDKTERYYVYRIEKHPSSYEDFQDKLHMIIDTACNTTTAEFIDELSPNTKYYYVFRSMDVHDYLSNPSDVYLVQMIEDNGLSFLRTEIVQFKQKDFKSSSKNTRKYISISPSLIQTKLNNSLLEGYNTAKEALIVEKSNLLGEDRDKIKESVWGKKFKLRIKSKNTNKFIDVKFKFDANYKELIQKNDESCLE